MKPPPLAYHRVSTVPEAVALLSTHGDEAKILAGGQSLLPLINLRLASMSHLVDLMHVEELRTVEEDADGFTIGAGVRQATVEDDVRTASAAPLLHQALPHVAHREIRNAGTVCGSAAHADAAAEIPTIAVAANASFDVAGPHGTRTVAADAFYTGYLSTVLAGDELVTRMRFPRPAPGTGAAFEEVAARRGDYAPAGAAATLTVTNGTISAARIAFLGVDVVPARVPEMEQLLEGQAPSAELFAEAAETASRGLRCIGNVHATAEYRARVAGVLTRRTLAAAADRAGGAQA